MKTELIASLTEDKDDYNKNLYKMENNISKADYEILIVKKHETLIKMKKKGIINIPYRSLADANFYITS